jgi:hypothetical protein
VQQLTVKFVDFGSPNCIIEPSGKEVVTRPVEFPAMHRQVDIDLELIPLEATLA